MPSLKNFPYKSQRDNRLNPSGSCNVTSIAMCLAYFGIVGDGSGQLEDQLYQRCLDRGWSRHSPQGLQQLVESYGLIDDFTASGSLADIRAAIDKGHPCVVHGFFTGFGHVIAINGYTEHTFIVSDPWGEWCPWYYNSVTSHTIEYSNKAIGACCDSFSQGEAMDRYESMSPAEAEACSSIWLHRIRKG